MVWILTLHLLHSPAAKIPSSITTYSFTFAMPPKARKMYKRNKWVTVPTASPAFSKGKMAESSMARPSTKPRATGSSDAPMKSVVGDLVQQSAAPRMKWSVEIPPRQSDAPLLSGALHPPIQSMVDLRCQFPGSQYCQFSSPLYGSSLAPWNSLGSPHGSPASPGNSPYHSSLQLCSPHLRSPLAFYFDEPDFDFRTPTPTPTQDHRDDTPLFLDDGEGSEDEIDHGLENGGDIDSGDEVLAKSLGGPFTEQQIAEIREIVDAMNQQLEQKAKEWERPLESVMRIGNLGINTRERRSGGNLWNAFHHSYEKDSDPDRPHHEYVEKTLLEWEGRKAKEPCWNNTIASKGLHQAAATHYLPAAMGLQGSSSLQMGCEAEVPKNYSTIGCGKEISEELQNLLKPFVGHIPRVPWATLPRFLANNHLKMENWVTELDFPNLMSLDVSVVRMDSWKKLWQAFFELKDDLQQNPNNPQSNSVATGSSRSQKRRSDTSGGPVQKKKWVRGGRKKGARDVISSEFIAESDEEPEEQGASTFDASLGGISGSASGSDPFAVPVNWENGLNTGVYNPVVPNDVPPSDFDALLAQYPDLALD
ncbi:hypothetical protein BS47DRAFT_1367202 [Hydnum rufescens UP504]|uniref:Uncharacterized protein n=1 Tax=Hydnum rufescens UP504 TaxID=1448309 RepID=A0A9P6AIY2_9AGAM|nr:hypothetical protein BS47DRAFT_1367202 [Hydnum rufescens UP504]